MKKVIFLLGFIILCAVQGQAQVTIGADQVPHQDALLEFTEGIGTDKILSEKGLLLPRVELKSANLPNPLSEHVKGMTVYNTVVGGTGVGEVYVSPGFYYNDGTQWVRLPLGGATNWFYMPSIPFATATNATAQTKDLYDEYIKQFGGGNGRLIVSNGAPTTIPYLPAATDLYYYVTDYDPAVFSNITIAADGKMTYDVTAAATDYTYINIVFVLK